MSKKIEEALNKILDKVLIYKPKNKLMSKKEFKKKWLKQLVNLTGNPPEN